MISATRNVVQSSDLCPSFRTKSVLTYLWHHVTDITAITISFMALFRKETCLALLSNSLYSWPVSLRNLASLCPERPGFVKKLASRTKSVPHVPLTSRDVWEQRGHLSTSYIPCVAPLPTQFSVWHCFVRKLASRTKRAPKHLWHPVFGTTANTALCTAPFRKKHCLENKEGT